MYKRHEFRESMKRKTRAKRNWYVNRVRACFDGGMYIEDLWIITRSLKFNVRYYPILREAVKTGHLSTDEIEHIMSDMRNGF